MFQTILIVLGVMLFCGLLLSPFYFFRDKKAGKEKAVASQASNRLSFPKSPIGRLKFFGGLVVFVLVGWIFSHASSDEGSPLGILVILLVWSGLLAVWFSKRLADIKPDTNINRAQVGIFASFVVFNILAAARDILTAVIFSLPGSVDSSSVYLVSSALAILYAVFGFGFLSFTFYLMLTKGARTPIGPVSKPNAP